MASLATYRGVLTFALVVTICACTTTKVATITNVETTPRAAGPIVTVDAQRSRFSAVLVLGASKLKTPLVPDRIAVQNETNRTTDLNTFFFRDFSMMLSESKLFGDVAKRDKSVGVAEVQVAPKSVILTLTANEVSDAHTAGGVGKAFLSGFFTLGASAVESSHTFSSDMTLLVERPDGMSRTYKASSVVDATYNQRPSGGDRAQFQDAYNKTSIRATAENWRSLLAQLIKDAQFFSEAKAK